MATESETADGLKTVQVDPAMLGLGGRGSRRATSRKSSRGGSGRTRPTLRDSVSQVDIAAQSAALQAAVEQALTTAGSAGRPHPPPPPSSSSTSGAPSVQAEAVSETKTVSSSLGNQQLEAMAPSHPRSTTSVSTAVQELNRLMEERARARIRKTVRAQQRRAMACAAGGKASQLPDVPESPEVTPATTAADNRPTTPLVGGSTSLRSPNDPPWGCLKGGSKLTYRNYRQTQRAARHSKDPGPSLASQADSARPKPRVRIRTSQPKVSTPAPGDVVSVGRQRSGKVAFVIGNGTRSNKRDQIKGGRRSVTNRARLRKAHLLRGGSNTPQRLVEEMARSVDIIGEVERPLPS